MAKNAYAEDEHNTVVNSAESHGGFFGLGKPNDGFAQYFSGRSWLNPVNEEGSYLPIFNVTLSRDVAITGMCTMQAAAVDKCLSA